MRYNARRKRRTYRRNRHNHPTVKKVARAVKKLQNQREVKTFTRAYDGQLEQWQPGSGGNKGSEFRPQPTNVEQGVDGQQFVGKEYQLLGMSMKLRVTRNSNVDEPQLLSFRLIGVVIKATTSGAEQDFGDMYKHIDDTLIENPISPLDSVLRDSYKENVRVLIDKVFNLGPRGFQISNGTLRVHFRKYLKINTKVELNEDNQVPGIKKAHVKFFLHTNTASDRATYQFVTKSYFVDP